MPNLIIERGREKGAFLVLNANGENVVGRDPSGAQLVISDVASSRRHFQIFERTGKWYVTDLGSRNGTFVNEEKVETDVELAPGDRLQVGETVFSFLEEEKAEAGKAGGLQGKEIGGYEIMERIGRGGMGTVYKARQKSMNRVVALKFLLPKLSGNPSFVNQFRAEARSAGQLNHPNVVQALDVFELNGLHCFSMEFMEGGCIQDLLSKRDDSRLPWEEAMPLLLDSARGLAFAEKRGIIHRDIKPDNLMLTSEQKVKIGDLGLAKSAADGDDGGTGIFGTPHFIAPEQAQGKPVNHAADIYALGATFYRVLAGRTPFMGATVKEILRAQINDPHKPITEIVPDFPKDLSAIVDRMMAKKVEDRYQSATTLLEDLEAFMLAHHIEMAGGVKSRKPFLIGMGVLVVALGGVIWWAATRPEKKGDTKTIYVPNTAPVAPIGPVKSDEDIQKEFDDAAYISFLKISGTEQGLGEITLDRRKEWEDVAARYAKLKDEHGSARKHVDTATKRAGEIRQKLAALEKEKVEVLDKAVAWWKTTESGIKSALAAPNWYEAIRLSSTTLKSAEWTLHKPHCPQTADAWLKGIADQAFNAANASLSATQQASDKKIAARNYKEAVDDLVSWETTFKPQVDELTKAALDEGGRFARILEQAQTWRQKTQGEIGVTLQKEYDQDRTTFINAYLKIRHRPADAADTGGPVFEFRFADAAAELRTALDGKLLTYIFANRMKAKVASLTQMQASWEAFVRMMAEKKLFAAREEIKGLPGMDVGTKALFDDTRPPTLTDLPFIRALNAGGTSTLSRAWSEFTPNEVYRVFMRPKLDRIPTELAGGLSAMFAELGDEDATGECMDRAKAAPGADAQVRAELTAIQAWTHTLKTEGTSAPEVKRAVDSWRKTQSSTDFFLLMDGRQPADIEETIFSEADIGLFFTNWGTEPAR